MDVPDIVKGHYGGPDLVDRILAALRSGGSDPDALTWTDLASIDELHAGFLPATRHLLELLDVSATSRLLDVGCGLGGPSRAAAAIYDCPVTGVDLTPEFVEAAKQLTRRVGLGGRADFRRSAGESLPFADGAFTRAMMIHVGMNIPDKAAVFAEVRRVLESGAIFGLFEQMRTGEGPLPYPLPWALDESASFVETLDDYTAQLERAGFAVELTQDRTAQVGGPPPAGDAPGVGPQAVFGPAFGERIANNIRATGAGLLAPVVVIARAT